MMCRTAQFERRLPAGGLRSEPMLDNILRGFEAALISLAYFRN